MINAQTMLNAVTGYPLGHTLSPQLHQIIYRNLKINAVMLAFPNQDIGEMMTVMRTLPVHLLAVTIPHKKAVIGHLDFVDETAKKIGAVNTVINKNGKLHGYNTDVIGIQNALKSVNLSNKNVLILGAGGAARPLCFFLRQERANIFCHNRTMEKAEELMNEFGGKPIQENELEKAKIDVIINATPVGMKPEPGESPFPKNLLHAGQTVFDCVYNPIETQLLKDAKQAGAATISGIDMLMGQAIAQVELWQGKAPNYDDIASQFLQLVNV